MRKVTIYSSEICTLCNSVENLLNVREIPYEKIMIDEDSSEHTQLTERTGMTTLPQVFIGSMLIGGYQETMAADQSGMLADLLVD
ncbi:MAG: glutaredoxin 3 [Solirubrobacteraceae bacterium]|jgi:glutaredoxin 3|nr:glutaredoxin 3 [Solirubrobacteraceae bacterium]